MISDNTHIIYFSNILPDPSLESVIIRKKGAQLISQLFKLSNSSLLLVNIPVTLVVLPCRDQKTSGVDAMHYYQIPSVNDSMNSGRAALSTDKMF